MTKRNYTQAVLAIVVVWFGIALAVGGLGLVESLRPPIPQVILFGLVGVLVATFQWMAAFRTWLFSVPLRWLISVHLVRFVGAYFLWLYDQGELPFAFAVPGGWGDIIVATLAVVLLSVRTTSRILYLSWNALGLADILLVVFTAASLARADPASMAALLRLPLSLLPTFVVPLIIFTHIVIFARLKHVAK